MWRPATGRKDPALCANLRPALASVGCAAFLLPLTHSFLKDSGILSTSLWLAHVRAANTGRRWWHLCADHSFMSWVLIGHYTPHPLRSGKFSILGIGSIFRKEN